MIALDAGAGKGLLAAVTHAAAAHATFTQSLMKS
jgi:hypothetical protein